MLMALINTALNIKSNLESNLFIGKSFGFKWFNNYISPRESQVWWHSTRKIAYIVVTKFQDTRPFCFAYIMWERQNHLGLNNLMLVSSKCNQHN